jgi:predicted NACHT family NTPase
LHSMHIPPELRVVHIFLREATLAKYYHKPKYDRFKHLAYHLNHFVLNPDNSMKLQKIA